MVKFNNKKKHLLVYLERFLQYFTRTLQQNYSVIFFKYYTLHVSDGLVQHLKNIVNSF